MSSSSQNRWWQCSVLCKETVKLLKEDKRYGVRPFPIDSAWCLGRRNRRSSSIWGHTGWNSGSLWGQRTFPHSAGHSVGTCWILECDTGAWLQSLILTPARLSVWVTCLGRAHLCPSGQFYPWLGEGFLQTMTRWSATLSSALHRLLPEIWSWAWVRPVQDAENPTNHS